MDICQTQKLIVQEMSESQKKNAPVTFVHGTDKDMEALTDRYTLSLPDSTDQ